MACAVFDANQCQFGMTSVDSVGERGTGMQGYRDHDEP